MKLSFLCVAIAGMLSFQSHSEQTDLPAPFEASFETAMNNPHVVLYYADKAFRDRNYDEALRWMLNAAEYNLPAAVINSKFMINNNLGTVQNREAVIAFLEHIAQDTADKKGDTFAQTYLADYYRGDRCVWMSPDAKSACMTGSNVVEGPVAGVDYKRSYYFYDRSSQQNERARYHAGMMDLLGLGVPRNVPYAIERLTSIAESGNASVAFLLGEVYQNGYWVLQDREQASKWFIMATQKKHPGAMLQLAQNYLRGVGVKDDAVRAQKAEALFIDVTEGVLANDTQRAEAFYRLGMLHFAYPDLGPANAAAEHMHFAAAIGGALPNEYSVMAYHWLAKQAESTSHKAALNFYHKGVELLSALSGAEQQKQASILQSLAQLYSQGPQRSEDKFSVFMNRYHRLMASNEIATEPTEQVFGFDAFEFPG